jgi:hypothetical protein
MITTKRYQIYRRWVCIFSPKRDAKGVQYSVCRVTNLMILIGGERLQPFAEKIEQTDFLSLFVPCLHTLRIEFTVKLKINKILK